MAMIEFVRNYTDESTDRGYQFEFRCDHCYSGYKSSFEPSLIGAAGGILQAAGSLFGGIFSSAGNSTYDIQRAIGGPAHDRALQKAVEEVKQKFRRCQRCGKWVCAEICWNQSAAQCTGCTPKYEQEVISQRNHAQLDATRQQLQEKALGTDYVSGIDMNPDVQVRLNPGAAAPQLQASATHCTACGATLTGGKFCAECGAPAPAPSPKSCSGCGHISSPGARFCEECGTKLV